MTVNDPIVTGSLRGVLGHEHPGAAKIARLEELDALRRFKWDTPYSDRISSAVHNPHLIALFQESLAGAPLLDMGAGPESWSNGARIAHEFAASRYVGVDPAFKEDEHFAIEGYPIHLLATGMLAFMSQVQSGIANYTFSGMNFLQGAYQDAVVEELVRTVKPGGLVFGVGSESIDWPLRELSSFENCSYLYEDDFEDSDEEYIPHDFFCFRKLGVEE